MGEAHADAHDGDVCLRMFYLAQGTWPIAAEGGATGVQALLMVIVIMDPHIET